MLNTLLKQIATDLNINKYNNESIEEYGDRIIYSALAAWSRTLVLGKSYTDLSDKNEFKGSNYYNVDIMHIQSRLSQVAYGMLIEIPHSKDWIGNEGIEEQSGRLASSIIKELIFCYELSQLNEMRRLTNSPVRSASFNNSHLILGGEHWKDPNNKVLTVGLGRWVKYENTNKDYKKIFNIPDSQQNEYYDVLLNSAIWNENGLAGQYKIFKTGTGLYYINAWVDFEKSKISNGMYLIRSVEVGGGYLLVKKDNDKVYVARLDKWYYDENEIYRIMYALDSYNYTPSVFKAIIYSDFVLLHCHSRLPNPEMRILLMSSWPGQLYNGTYHRIIPKFIWDEVKDVLINLGIKIECTGI